MRHSLFLIYIFSRCLDFLTSDCSCLMHYFSVFGYQIINMLHLSLWISDETLLLVFNILVLGVLISDETLYLVLYILLFGVCISHGTLLLVFDITSLFLDIK